jgi:hypothetical protein
MPVVRALYWPALVPQVVVIAALTLIIGLCAPTLELPNRILISAAAYMAGCRLLRARVAREHIRGMKAYKAGSFEEASRAFEASHSFWSSHRTLDAWRSVFGIANYNPYRVMALLNGAFCYAQLGQPERAVLLYRQVLIEYPGNTFALTSLRMLGAVPTEAHDPASSTQS